MKRSWQLVVPYIGPKWNLLEFLESLGSVPPGVNCLIVDNSPDSHVGKALGPIIRPGLEVVAAPENLGIAASWNLGLERGADQTLLLSASCRFTKPLGDFLAYSDSAANAYGLDYVSAADDEHAVSWHCKAIGIAAVSSVGYFDENFFPTDMEEIDYERRLSLRRGRQRNGKFRGTLDSRIAGVKYAGASIALKAGCIWPEGRRISGDGCANYYKRKWGGVQGEEALDLPFGDKPLSWWPKPPRRWEVE